MIKINLKATKQEQAGAFLGGVDLSLINFKAVLIFLLVGLGVDIFLSSSWEDDITRAKSQIESLNKKKKDAERRLQEMHSVEVKIDNLKKQEELMVKKLSVVQDVLEKNNNPFNIMQYTANNIPKDLWIREMIIDGNDLSFQGYGLQYNDIGVFLDNLKRSIFFGNQVSLRNTKSVTMPGSTRRIEEFNIKAMIKQFE